MNKLSLINRIIEELEKEADTLAKAANDAHAYATDEDSQSDGKYDTRGIEASYLAGAQAEKATEVLEAIHKYNALRSTDLEGGGSGEVSVGKVVEVEGPAGVMLYFVGPDRGGLELEFGEREVMVITPEAPIAQAMSGKQAGTGFSFNGNDGWEIVSVD